MLERMGWSEGKGLGANEQGTTEFIRVKKRNDNRGTAPTDIFIFLPVTKLCQYDP
jgi:Pin2-interacting protein X1